MASRIILQPNQSILIEADTDNTKNPHYCVVEVKQNGTIRTTTGKIVEKI